MFASMELPRDAADLREGIEKRIVEDIRNAAKTDCELAESLGLPFEQPAQQPDEASGTNAKQTEEQLAPAH